MELFRTLSSPSFPVTISVSQLKLRLFNILPDHSRICFETRSDTIQMKDAIETAVAAQKVALSKWMLLPWLTTIGPSDAQIHQLATRLEVVFKVAFASFTPAPLHTTGQEAHFVREAGRFARFLSVPHASTGLKGGHHDLAFVCSSLYKQYPFSALMRFLLFDGANQDVAVSATKQVEAACIATGKLS